MTKIELAPLYSLSFMEAMDCHSTEFEIKPYIEDYPKNTSMVVRYKNEQYKVATFEDLCNTIEEYISSPEGSEYIDPGAISIALFPNVIYNRSRFYKTLLDQLTEQEQKELTLILGLHHIVFDKDFWELLREHSNQMLYGKAVCLAVQMAKNKQAIVEDMVQYMINSEDEFLFDFQSGPITSIIFHENEPTEKEFFVYPVCMEYDKR